MDEKTQQYITQLTERSEKIREELIEHERQFTTKKEEFIKIQGALEALHQIASDS